MDLPLRRSDLASGAAAIVAVFAVVGVVALNRRLEHQAQAIEAIQIERIALGALRTTVESHGQMIQQVQRERGAVRISMEADQRLTKLEAHFAALQSDVVRRLERIEAKLDR